VVDDEDAEDLFEAEERFAVNLRRVREERGMSQGKFAEEMTARRWPWRQQTVTRVETGRRTVRLGEAKAAADILGVTLDRLLWPSAEATEVAMTDDAIARVRIAWHEASDATVRLLAALAYGERTLVTAQASKYERVRRVAGELDAEIKDSSLESAVADGLARYEDPEEQGDAPARPTVDRVAPPGGLGGQGGA
jgi:transcriptional regulator with XRE-family HTH domain